MFEAKYKGVFVTDELRKRIDQFFDYFLREQIWIERKIDTRDRSFIQEFEKELNLVFENQKFLRFNFFKMDGYYEVVFYYGRDDYLFTIFSEIAEKKRSLKLENWRFVLQK